MVLVGLLCPFVGQEFAEGGAIVFFLRYPEQEVFHPLARVNTQGLAAIHKGEYDYRAHGSIVVAAEQEVRPSQGNCLMAFSTWLFSIQKRPSSIYRPRRGIRGSVYLMALPMQLFSAALLTVSYIHFSN